MSKVPFPSTFLNAFHFKISWNQVARGNYKNKISSSHFYFYSDFEKIRIGGFVNGKTKIQIDFSGMQNSMSYFWLNLTEYF